MSTLLQSVSHANKLNEIHELVKGLYREKFAQRVADIEPGLREIAKRHDGNLIGAATEVCKDPKQDPRETLLILAVAVELTTRDKT